MSFLILFVLSINDNWFYVTEVNQKSINNWLNKAGRSKKWLAQTLGINPRTTSNWFRPDREVPRKYIRQVRELMERDLIEQQNIVIKVNPDEFDKIEMRAQASGLSIQAYCKKRIISDCL